MVADKVDAQLVVIKTKSFCILFLSCFRLLQLIINTTIGIYRKIPNRWYEMWQ